MINGSFETVASEKMAEVNLMSGSVQKSRVAMSGGDVYARQTYATRSFHNGRNNNPWKRNGIAVGRSERREGGGGRGGSSSRKEVYVSDEEDWST